MFLKHKMKTMKRVDNDYNLEQVEKGGLFQQHRFYSAFFHFSRVGLQGKPAKQAIPNNIFPSNVSSQEKVFPDEMILYM